MLALYDSFRGLARCKIISAQQSPDYPGGYKFRAEITARNHPIYKRGEIVESNGLHIIPRVALTRHGHTWRILAYSWDNWADDLPTETE